MRHHRHRIHLRLCTGVRYHVLCKKGAEMPADSVVWEAIASMCVRADSVVWEAIASMCVRADSVVWEAIASMCVPADSVV